jgi:hypothetical protein
MENLNQKNVETYKKSRMDASIRGVTTGSAVEWLSGRGCPSIKSTSDTILVFHLRTSR